MIAVDSNILVYAHRRDSAFNVAACSAMRVLAEGRSPWVIPWSCVHEFIAIATHPRIYDPPSTIDEALTQVEAWLDSPSLVMLSETAKHWESLRETLETSAVVGARVHDARIAAICVAGGVRELWSADRDFSRFDIKVHNPLKA